MARVVVAEDDLHILRVISLWLSRQGHTVFTATHGGEALELIAKHDPDLLITDINMPEVDGMELLQRLRSDGIELAGVIVLTNRWDHREIEQHVHHPRLRVQPKPFSPSGLATLVDELMNSVESPSKSEAEAT